MKKSVFWATSFSMASLTVWLGVFQKRDDFASFIGFYGLFFLIFCWILKSETAALDSFFVPKKEIEKGQGRLAQFFGLGFFMRFLLLFSVPNLSEDVWRFVWDGRLLLDGRDPFLRTPMALMADPMFAEMAFSDLFEKLNSKPFYSVYPPVCQAVFAAAAFFGKIFQSDFAAIFSIKFFLFVCEAGTGWLLFRKMKTPFAGAFLIYWLNPLVILEVVGNCHFEGAAVFFMLVGLKFISDNSSRNEFRRYRFAAAWSLAICSKLMPLLFLPFFVRKMDWPAGFLKMSAAVGAICTLLFWPFFDLKKLENMATSLDLYFRAFEINASLYYIGRAAAMRVTGWNEIAWLGPTFAAAGAALILGLARAVFFRKMRLADGLIWAAAAHLFCSTTVHAWYVLPLLAFSVFSKRWLFPLFWSGLIALSYSHYSGGAFSENYLLIGLEYLGVGVAIVFDLFFMKKECSKGNSSDENDLPRLDIAK